MYRTACSPVQLAPRWGAGLRYPQAYHQHAPKPLCAQQQNVLVGLQALEITALKRLQFYDNYRTEYSRVRIILI